MPAITYYLKNALAAGSSQGSLQIGGTAPTAATTTTGWTVAKTASAQYSQMLFNTKRAATTFGGFKSPDQMPCPDVNDAWRGETAQSIGFAAGNWSLTLPMRSVTTAASGSVRMRTKVWKSGFAVGSDKSAEKIAESSTTSSLHARAQNVTLQQAQVNTFSIYVQAVERTDCVLYINAAGGNDYIFCHYNLTGNGATSNLTMAGTATGASASITSIGKNWYRCVLTGQASTTSGATTQVEIAPVSGGLRTYAGTVGSGIWAWGAQLEAGSSATAYEVTTTTAGTRNKCLQSQTLDNATWINDGNTTVTADDGFTPPVSGPAGEPDGLGGQLGLGVNVTTSSGALSTSADTNLTVTWSAPAFELVNEYLFLQIGAEIITASGSTSADAVFRVGAATLVTPNQLYTLKGNVGTFSVTAPTVTLTYTPGAGGPQTYTLTAQSGSFSKPAVTGSLVKQYVDVGQKGAFTLSLKSANLVKQYVDTAAAGAFALALKSANLIKQYNLVGQFGAFTKPAVNANLTAKYTLVAQKGTFTVTPKSANFYLPVTIWAASTVPGTPDQNDNSALEVGVKFRANVAGVVTGIRFYKGGTTNGGTHTGSLWDLSQNRLATGTFTGETTSGWQQLNFPTPVAITAGTTYIASYYAPIGHYSADNNYFSTTNPSGVDRGPLHALGNSESVNGVYTVGASSSYPSSTFNASNYWVDVLFASTATNQVYSLTAQTGSFSKPAVNANFVKQYVAAEQYGTFTYSLKSANFVKTYIDTAQKGTFTLTLRSANVIKQYVDTAQFGSFATTMRSANFVKTYNLVAQKGTFSVTGPNATLSAILGPVYYNLVAQKGTFSVAGFSANLLKSQYLLTANKGTFTLTLRSATLIKQYNLVGQFGTYTITPKTATLIKQLILVAQKGAFATTLRSATFIKQYAFVAQKGTFTSTLRNANLIKSVSLVAQKGTFGTVVWNGGLIKQYNLVAQRGVYAFTGRTAALQFPLFLRALPGTFSTPGRSALLTLGGATFVTYPYTIFQPTGLTFEDGLKFTRYPDASFGVSNFWTKRKLQTTLVHRLSQPEADSLLTFIRTNWSKRFDVTFADGNKYRCMITNEPNMQYLDGNLITVNVPIAEV